MNMKRLSAEQITAMTAAASHRVIAAKSPSDIHVVSVIQLSVNEVLFYEKNPRRHENPKFAEIKESIRIRGLESALYITKRPGSGQYMLARGGKTRLKALQELAQEDPNKWGKLDFHEIPWVSESEILAAHLVENTGREAMCFWDLAEGIATLRDQIATELGKPISSRALPDLLGERGVKVERAAIMAAEFATVYLQGLGKWKPKLGVKHLETIIRPKFSQLQDLWLLKSPNDEDGFKSLVDQAVSTCVAEQGEYSPDALVNSVVTFVATAMQVTSESMAHALQSHQVSSIRSLDEFLNIAQRASDLTSDEEISQYQDLQDEAQMPLSESGGFVTLDANGDYQDRTVGPSPKPVLSDAARQNINRLMGSGNARATDVPGIPGVSVARGLTPRAQKSSSDGSGVGSIHGGPLSQQELSLLEQEGSKGLARKVLWSELMAFGDIAGIAHLINESNSPHMPYGFYVELPEPGHLGASSDDIAVQAWWFLAAVSSQGNGHVLPLLVGPDAPVCAFRETGPGSFAQAMLEPQALTDAVRHRLGGQEIPGFELLMMLITRRDHPLHQQSLAVLDALANWNFASGSHS
jgi:ParB family protein of integrating conjugative element (PFGI_1 class)